MSTSKEKAVMEIPVSVIVPVYNVYEWLDECLESIVKQTFSDFEIVLINDGSTDGSDRKCEEWEKKDKRIHYISKKNEGLAITRNLGIQIAKGKYIVFIDSDDWIDSRFLELMYHKIVETDADIVECDFWRYNNNTGEMTKRTCYGKMGIEYTLKEHMIYGQTMAWKYMSRKSLWVDNEIEMPNCLSASHGVYALLIALSNKVVNVHEPLYYYRRFRKGSILDTKGENNDPDQVIGLQALENLISEFKRKNLYVEYENTLRNIVMYSLSDYLASQFGRLEEKAFNNLVSIYYSYLSRNFSGCKDDKYFIMGGYNLNRILSYVGMIQNPYYRFNFSSIISIMKDCQGIEVVHKNKYRMIMLDRDIASSFWKIIEEYQPKYLFMDFMEERFDIVEYKGGYITKSDAFDGMEASIEGYRIIERRSAECRELWQSSVQEFMRKIQKYVPMNNIYVIKSYLSEYVGDCNEKQKFEQFEYIGEINKILSEYYSFIEKNYSDIQLIETQDFPLYMTDQEYEYGAIPSHLNEMVNMQIAERIMDGF